MSFRLTLLLITLVLLMLLLAGNPQAVPIQFLFWKQEVELYKVIIGSVAGGALWTCFYNSHSHSFRRFRKNSSDKKLQE